MREEYYKNGKCYKVVDTREVNQTKADLVNRLKNVVKDKLAKTDWTVIRQIERGIPLPSEIADWRQEVFNMLDEIETDLKDIPTIEEFDRYYKPSEFYKLVEKEGE